MYMHTYGKPEDPVILMLHPMGISAGKLYEIIGSRFKGDYYLLIPDMGNHGMEKSEFVSAETEAANVKEYLIEKNITDLALVYGQSMGAVVALNIVSDKRIRIGSLFLDGAPIAKLGFVMSRLFAPVLIWQRGIYEKNDRRKLAEFIERWGEDLNEHMRESFMAFSDRSIKNIARACVQGNGIAIPEDLQRRTYMEWGREEEFAKKSPALARSLYPLAQINVRPGFNHCEYMIKENADYIAKIESLV